MNTILIYHTAVAVTVITTYLTLVRANSYQCPSKCSCNETIVKCINRQLANVPDFNRISFNPNTIDLSENKIEQILENDFYSKHLKALKYLELNDNNIFNVQDTAFIELSEIELIDLSNNQLDVVPSEMVEKNTKLLELNLSNNLFGSNTPTIVSQSLLILDLSSSKLETFTEDNLRGMPNLKALYLHVNNLQHLDYHMFKHSSLNFLDVAYNPWKCHCDTLKLFDHLIKFGLTQLKTTVQCRHSNKLFEDVYGINGEITSQFCHKRTTHINNHRSVDTDSNNQEIVKERPERSDNYHNNANSKENMFGFIMHFEVLIIVGIVSVLLVVSLITLAVVVRRTNPNQRVIYGKIPV